MLRILVAEEVGGLVPLLLIVIATLVALRRHPGWGRWPQAIGAIVVLAAKVAHLIWLNPEVGLFWRGGLPDSEHPLVWLALWLMGPWVVTLGWLAFAVGMLLATTEPPRT